LGRTTFGPPGFKGIPRLGRAGWSGTYRPADMRRHLPPVNGQGEHEKKKKLRRRANILFPR